MRPKITKRRRILVGDIVEYGLDCFGRGPATYRVTHHLRRVDDIPRNRYKLLYCRPNEATHLSLVGICGAQAAIEDCRFVRVVAWSKNLILNERREAVRSFWLDNNFWPTWYKIKE